MFQYNKVSYFYYYLDSNRKYNFAFTSRCSSLLTFGDRALILVCFLPLLGLSLGGAGSFLGFSLSINEISPLCVSTHNLKM